jgi:hypothetical protein
MEKTMEKENDALKTHEKCETQDQKSNDLSVEELQMVSGGGGGLFTYSPKPHYRGPQVYENPATKDK